MPTIRRISLAVLALIIGVSVGRNAAAGCEKDTDCKGDRVCFEAKCMTPDAANKRELAAVEQPVSGDLQTPTPETSPLAEVAPTSEGSAPAGDDKLAVEQALEMNVDSYYSSWGTREQIKFPVFRNYMYYRLNKERKKGVILAAVVGGSVFGVGTVATIVLQVIGMEQSNACVDTDENDCTDAGLGPTIAGWIVAGTFLATSVTLVIVGAHKAKKAKRKLLKLSQVQSAKLESPGLEFVGFAPLIDSSYSPSGLSLSWQF